MDEQKRAEARKRIDEAVERARRQVLVAKNFDEMEEVVVEIGREIEEIMLGAAAEQRESAGRPGCPECGTRMRHKDRVPRKIKTSRGNARFERQRWVCAGCGASRFPPG
jgi:transposase-like protein